MSAEAAKAFGISQEDLMRFLALKKPATPSPHNVIIRKWILYL